MVVSPSRRRTLCLLLPAGLAVGSGCAQSRPAYFELRANDAARLRILVTADDGDETVYDRSRSLESGDVLKMDKDTLQHPPYYIELRTDGERIWSTDLNTCNRLVLSVSDGKDVEIVEYSAC
jgi:hypothetical protein